MASVNSADELRAEFITDVIPDIINMLSDAMVFDRIVCKNLFDPADWDEFSPASAWLGQRSGGVMPAFVAIAFKSDKPASNQPPARKRFGYISETDVTGALIPSPGAYATLLDALATELGNTLAPVSGNFYDPVIVKRIPYVTPSGKDAWRLPTNPGEAVTFPAIDWSWNQFVTSQNTRKAGRGI